MTRVRAILLAIVAVVGSCSKQEQAPLRLDPADGDFGRVAAVPTTPLELSIQVHNVSDTRQTVTQVAVGCGYITVRTVLPMDLEPGGSATLIAQAAPDGLRPGRHSCPVVLHDEWSVLATGSVTYDYDPALMADRHVVSLTASPDQAQVTQQVNLAVYRRPELQWTVQPTEGLQSDLKPEGQAGRRWRLSVTLPRDSQLRGGEYPLVLRSDDPAEPPVTVTVRVSRGDGVVVRPGSVILGRSDLGTPQAVRRLRWQASDGWSLRKAETGADWLEVSPGDDGTLAIGVIADRLGPGFSRSFVRLHFGSASDVSIVEVPVVVDAPAATAANR